MPAACRAGFASRRRPGQSSLAVAGFGARPASSLSSGTGTPRRPSPPMRLPPQYLRRSTRRRNPAASDGVWVSGLPVTLARTWGRCDRDFERCELIPGAASSTYRLSGGDVGWRFFVRVTATTLPGTTVEFSGTTPPVAAAPPFNVVVPMVSGPARPGSILVTTAGEWSGTGPLSLTYQWQACDAVRSSARIFPGEAAPVIRVTAAHLGNGCESSSLRPIRAAWPVPHRMPHRDSRGPNPALCRPQCQVEDDGGGPASDPSRGCVTGRIRRAYSASVARNRVIAQAPRAGARLRSCAKVSLVLSRGKKR